MTNTEEISYEEFQNFCDTLPDATTGTGGKIWYNDPSKYEGDIKRDISIAISNIRRYNGHVNVSLKTHLQLCIHLCNKVYKGVLPVPVWREIVAEAAFHDMPEIIVGDIVTGLKDKLNDFAYFEDEWTKHFRKEFGMSHKISENIKYYVKFIDILALYLEMKVSGHQGIEVLEQILSKKEKFDPDWFFISYSEWDEYVKDAQVIYEWAEEWRMDYDYEFYHENKINAVELGILNHMSDAYIDPVEVVVDYVKTSNCCK